MGEELGLGSFNDKLETDRGNIESMYPLRRKIPLQSRGGVAAFREGVAHLSLGSMHPVHCRGRRMRGNDNITNY